MNQTVFKILLVLFFNFCLFPVALAQNQKINPILISKLKFDADTFLGYDAFGYYYQIKNNVFSKRKGTEIFEYKNVSLGRITTVDLQNPLKIVVFYEDFNAVILLDNQLNETTKINFSQNSTPIVASAVGMSTQNQLWIYNALNQQIGLFDYLKNEYKTTSTPLIENIKYYQTDFNTFYWIDEKNNWLSCDIFGKITTLGKIPRFDAIVLLNSDQFIFSDTNLLYLKNVKNKNLEANSEIKISEKTFLNFYYKDQILSIFTPERITNYKILTP